MIKPARKLNVFLFISIIFTLSLLTFTNPSTSYAAEHRIINIGEQYLFGGEGVSTVFPDLASLISLVVEVALGAAGVVFFAMLVWGGIRYISARGDEKAIGEARDTLTNAVIGLLIVISSFAIIRLIALATGADISIF